MKMRVTSRAIDKKLSVNNNQRQSGKTIGVLIRYVWVYHFGTINSQMAFSNKRLDDSQLNLKRFNNIFEMLPDYLKAHVSPNDRNNLDYIESAENGNSIKALSSPTTKQNADQLGRGFTSPSIWFDEFGFLKFNGIVYAAASPALTRAAEAAERNGTPYGKTITTTPNDRDSYEGAYAYSILDGAVRFDNTWYDKSYSEIKNIIDTNSSNNFVYIKFGYKDLGRDERWFRNQCRELNNDLMKIKRELLLEWTLANDRSPFSEEQLSSISSFVRDEPISYMYFNKIYKFNVYEEFHDMFTTNWIIAIDIGGGLQQDFTVITIIDPRTKRLKAIYRSNSILSDELIELVENMVDTFLPNAVIVPERNSLGIPILDRMAKSNIIRPRLYYEVKDRMAERKVDDPRKNEMAKFKTRVQVYGQVTDKKSRDIMFNEILAYMVENEPDAIICPELFGELKTLERNNRGKIEARQGGHDDVVMAWLIGLYALMYGKNINKFVKLKAPSYMNDQGEIVSGSSKKYVKFVSTMYNEQKMSDMMQELISQERNRLKSDEDSNVDSKSRRINKNISRLLGK